MSKEKKPYKSEENLGFLLWQTNMLWQREQNRALDSIGLTQTQFVAKQSSFQQSNSGILWYISCVTNGKKHKVGKGQAR